MKIIETVIVYEDYNYVEGNLKLKFSGVKLNQFINGDEFSIENILSTKLYVYKKYIAPNVPTGINKDRVFALQLPYNISTYVNDGDKELAFNANFDKIICDDAFVTEKGELKIDRYNTVKDEGKIFSTINVKVFGLKKNNREEIEKVSFYELFPSVVGEGEIEIEPKKEYYAFGEKVKIKAIPKNNSKFIEWRKDFSHFDSDEIDLGIEKDVYFKAVFVESEIIDSSKSSTFLDDFKIAYKSNKRLNSIIGKSKASFNSNTAYNNTKPSNINVGCFGAFFEGVGILFQVIGYLISALFFIGFLTVLISIFGWYSLWIAVFIAAMWLIPKLFQFLGRFNILGYLFNLLFIGIVLLSFYNLFNVINTGSSSIPTKPKRVPKTIENVKENTSIDFIHFVEWEDSDKNKYSTNLKVNSDYVLYESNIKQTFPNLYTELDYNSLLGKLSIESKESLYFVFRSLDSIKSSNDISYLKFPDVVVSMIQSIPYYAILDDSCNPFDYQDKSLRQLLQNNPCQGYIKHGIKSPAEFLKDLKADCDSRTLLLFTILKHYKYDVAIFGSEYYKHSLLGINTGQKLNELTYKEYNDKRYYLWETTTKNFGIGEISNEIKNTNYWNLNLK
ncbi:hypothetical protein [Psychroserpens sp. Hel_I_66]|uniref:hypothetical protein n=1 Tax=Psychroserpens sp. Hel_I_66 TaxID=1250004 RepID=UPI000646D667|nr:hypothetical protein [Psychroserpens sp. Hel_I_66]